MQPNSSTATGFNITNGVKTFVNSAGNPVADQNAASDFLYGNPSGTAAKSSTPTTTAAPTSSYAVVTSQPATQNYNAIQQDYNTNIKPNIDNATNTKAQQDSLPVITGYNVSANPTGNQGEQKATNNATGQSYYITPQNQGSTAPTADDIKTILSNSAPAGNGTPVNSTSQNNQSTPSFAQQAQDQTGINPTTENQNYQNQVSQENDDITSAYDTYKQTIQSLMNGSFPLTSAQQSLVDATNQAFSQMTQQANLKAAALSSETGGVSDKVNATAGELTNITSQQAAAVAKLELGFQDQNYKMVTDSYNEFKDLETQKMDSIEKLHNSVMDTYNTALTTIKDQATFNQTVFKNAQDLAQSQYEFRDLKDSMGNTIGTQVFDKATGSPVSSKYNAGQTDPTTGITTPVTTQNTDGTVSSDGMFKTLQSVVPQPYQALVWEIVNGKGDAPNIKTKSGLQLASWVAQVDPTLADGSGGFDATKYQARQTMQKSLASYGSGSYGSAILSANKVIAHLGSYLGSTNKIVDGSYFNMINKFEALTHGQIETAGEANTEATVVADEMGKFLKGTGSVDIHSADEWKNILDPFNPKDTIKGNVQGVLNSFAGQLNAFTEQYKTVMGKDPDMGTILQPQTVQQLSQFKNQGFKVDIPGVYYTDKTAWQTYGGGTQDQWNQAAEHLNANGFPLTQENILQWAQASNE